MSKLQETIQRIRSFPAGSAVTIISAAEAAEIIKLKPVFQDSSQDRA